MQFLATVRVVLKPTVNDPQGLTVQSALGSLGFNSVTRVRVGKHLEVALEAADRDEASALVQEMCRQLLANPVIETFDYELAEQQGLRICSNVLHVSPEDISIGMPVQATFIPAVDEPEVVLPVFLPASEQ